MDVRMAVSVAGSIVDGVLILLLIILLLLVMTLEEECMNYIWRELPAITSVA